MRGAFHIRVNGILLRSFYILILIPPDYPNSVPNVWEIGDTIIKHIDNHFKGNEELCLFVPDERWKYWAKGASFQEFLEQPVRDFFLSQIYRENTKNGEWAFGERRHGYEGILDYYREELETDNKQVIVKFLEYLAAPDPKGHWLCFCGSNKKMRLCHFDKLLDLRTKVDMTTARKSLGLVMRGLVYESKEQVFTSKQLIRQLAK